MTPLSHTQLSHNEQYYTTFMASKPPWLPAIQDDSQTRACVCVCVISQFGPKHLKAPLKECEPLDLADVS